MDRTNAERQRRYIARLKAKADAGAAGEARARRLEVEVAILNARVSRLKASKAPQPD
jgi:hypothetical protein